jgi:hypothetical protein
VWCRCGALVALLLSLLCWLIALLDFRCKLLLARQGKLPFALRGVPLRYGP